MERELKTVTFGLKGEIQEVADTVNNVATNTTATLTALGS